MGCLRRYIIVAVIMFALPAVIHVHAAESILAKNISIHVNNMRVGMVLKTIEEKGNFTFSYNSNIVKTDSLVTINADNWTIKEVLDHLLLNRFEYKETRNFVILRYAPLQLSLTTEKAAAEGDEYHISGFVTDEQNGKKLENASVYDRVLLQSTLTDKDGHFELLLKNNGQPVMLTISKEFYKDTTITFLAGVTVNPSTNKPRSLIDYVINNDYEGIVSAVGQNPVDVLDNTTLGWSLELAQSVSRHLPGLICMAFRNGFPVERPLFTTQDVSAKLTTHLLRY